MEPITHVFRGHSFVGAVGTGICRVAALFNYIILRF